MTDIQKALDLARDYMLSEIYQFTDRFGRMDAEREIISAIRLVPEDEMESDEADYIDDLLAPFFETIARTINESIQPAFEAAFADAKRVLLNNMAGHGS